MIVGIGTDMVAVSRWKDLIQKFGLKVAKKILTVKELEIFFSIENDNKPNFLAKRFAAKEAIVKALGTGFRDGISFLDIEIDNDNFGKPFVKLFNIALDTFNSIKGKSIHISISDEKNYAIAFSVIES
jgi:holo-[acyl-carrier protein] synthase